MWGVGIDKSFGDYSGKENREMGQWLEGDVEVGMGFPFFLVTARTVIMCVC